MPYRYSQIDRSNLDWFERDNTRGTLLCIQLRRGRLRGLHDVDLRFRYPITAIAGRNGTGKTTALALAACAFHNTPAGHNPLGRKNPYYTFSDFFVQAVEETAPGGLDIWYEILHDSWAPSKRLPEGEGRAWQRRKKAPGGRWNDYDMRVDRDVVFFGIERIVPHTERSVYRSYRSRFRDRPEEGWEDGVRKRTSVVLNRAYERLWFKTYRGYTLPMVETDGHVCSGFNLGAGENAVIAMMAGILSCKESLLLVIDEIELGLHEEAQARLIEQLKELCKLKHIQVICTTHSPTVLGCLPPEGRLFIETCGNSTTIVGGISAAYAAGRLSGLPSMELDILAEDDVAAAVILHSLGKEGRARTRILPLGSAAAVIRHMAARRKDKAARDCIAILDGDMVENKERFIDLFLKSLEKVRDPQAEKAWLIERLSFLPGGVWPERWVVSTLVSATDTSASKDFGVTSEELCGALKEGLLEDRHGEYQQIAKRLSLGVDYLRERLAYHAVAASPPAAEAISKAVRDALARTSA